MQNGFRRNRRFSLVNNFSITIILKMTVDISRYFKDYSIFFLLLKVVLHNSIQFSCFRQDFRQKNP